MLKYQRKTFHSFFHLQSIDHVMLGEEEELPLQIDLTIKNNEIELPATITLDYLAQPVFSIEIAPYISDFELLYTATMCIEKISTDEKVIELMNSKRVKKKIIKLNQKLKQKIRSNNENKSNIELFFANVKYKINDEFYGSTEQIDIIKNNVNELFSKMDDVKQLLEQINTYISGLIVQEETKSLYFYCIQSFYEWMFYIKRENFPRVTVADINEYLDVYQATDYYKNLAIKQVLKIQEIRRERIDIGGIKWNEVSKPPHYFYKEAQLLEAEMKLLDNLASHRRQIEDYNNYLRSTGMEPHSYSRLRDHMRNWIYFRLAAETMLKSKELIALNFEDIDLDNLRIIAKKRKGKQIVAITKDTATYLVKYQEFRKAYDDKIEEEKHYFRWMYGSVLKDKSKKEEELARIKPFFNDYERKEFSQLDHELATINGQIESLRQLSKREQTKQSLSLGELRTERKALNNKFAKKYAEVKRKYSEKADQSMKEAVFVSSHSKRVNSNTMEKILSNLDLTTEGLRMTRYTILKRLQIDEHALMKTMGYEIRQKITELIYENTLKSIEETRINYLGEKEVDKRIKGKIVDNVYQHHLEQYPKINKSRLKREVIERYEDYSFTRLALLKGVFERYYIPLAIELEMREKEVGKTNM
jgi:integrase